ncbi:MAG: Xaa-Pro peptidase family protein [Bacillota bacterium]|nr:Xaa-Pro peptidase family protein [Bacillota bacterium]MDW7683194.1 Xaa-Pro peptidase family protein [Bacillota bacterium]
MEKRTEALRAHLQQENAAAILITNPVNVAYLSGFTGTLGYLLVTEKAAWLLTDFRYLEQARAQAAGWDIVDVCGSAWKQVAALLDEEGIRGLLAEGDHLTVDVFEKVQAALEGVTLQVAPSPVGMLRKIKSEQEISLIEAAVRLTDQAFDHILTFIQPGVPERDIALELEYFMRKNGASGPSFDMIVASGERSALPHGVAGEKTLEHGDAVVMDFGCVLNGYCSDMTRTVFVGDVSARQREVYDAVLASQKAALASLRAGLTGKEADALARDVLAGFGLSGHFGHGLGHGLGREVHEVPRLSPAAVDVLEPGMVVTVEPGVYLGGEFGVRIEDVVVIEEKGVRNLTGSSKELFCR